MEPMTKDYFRRGLREDFTTESPWLVSSSRWLNDPRFREYVSKHSLRRNHRDAPITMELPDIVPILEDHQRRDADYIEAVFTAERRRNPAFDAWLSEGFVSTYTIEDLRQHPPGSCGDLLRGYLELNGYEIAFPNEHVGAPQFDYFQLRLTQQHDLEHILGGFAFDWIGELSATWLRYGSYQRHLGPELCGIVGELYAFLLAPSIMRTMLHYPQAFDEYWDSINQAMLVGRTSEPVFMMKYEPVLHLPPSEARKKLGYRNVVERDTQACSDVWSEGCPTAKDPRRPSAQSAA